MLQAQTFKFAGDVKSLHIQSERDVVVIETDETFTAEQMTALVAAFHEATGLSNPVVVLLRGRVRVVHREDDVLV